MLSCIKADTVKVERKRKIKGYLRGKSSDLVADLTWEIGKKWVQNNFWSVWFCGHGWWRFGEEKLFGTARLLEHRTFEEPESFVWECFLCLGLSKEVCSRNRGSVTNRSQNSGQVGICFQLFGTCLRHWQFNSRGGRLGAGWDNYFSAFPTLHIILVILASKQTITTTGYGF